MFLAWNNSRMGDPQDDWFIRENPKKMDELGDLHFRKAP